MAIHLRRISFEDDRRPSLLYLLSVERPAVPMREEEPTKTKSWAVLLWHCNVWQRETKKTVCNSDSNREGSRRVNKSETRTLRRSRQTKLKTNMTEKEKVALLASYQVWFGCVPTCVGLPETQTPISIHDTKLHKTFREQISDFAEIKLQLFFILHQTWKHIVGCSSCVCTPIKNLHSL